MTFRRLFLAAIAIGALAGGGRAATPVSAPLSSNPTSTGGNSPEL